MITSDGVWFRRNNIVFDGPYSNPLTILITVRNEAGVSAEHVSLELRYSGLLEVQSSGEPIKRYGPQMSNWKMFRHDLGHIPPWGDVTLTHERISFPRELIGEYGLNPPDAAYDKANDRGNSGFDDFGLYVQCIAQAKDSLPTYHEIGITVAP